jgi:hypothetical protein
MYEYDGLRGREPDTIIEFDSLSFPPYFLGAAPEQSRLLDERRVFPASMCRISSLPIGFWRTFSMTPALNRLIGTRTITRIAIDRLKLPQLEVEQLSKAFTTPSSLAGIDYEYLETLGDSILKCVVLSLESSQIADPLVVQARYFCSRLPRLSYRRRRSSHSPTNELGR